MSLRKMVINEMNRSSGAYRDVDSISCREVKALIRVLERCFGNIFKEKAKDDLNHNSSKE